MDDQATSLLDMTVGIVANYVAKNAVQPDEVAKLIASTHVALAGAGHALTEPVVEVEKPSAQAIRRSQTPDGLVSLVDGKTYKSLKRHLTTNGLTPDEYRERYGLDPSDLMVSPAYSARGSELAKSLGLGRKGSPHRGGRKPKSK